MDNQAPKVWDTQAYLAVRSRRGYLAAEEKVSDAQCRAMLRFVVKKLPDGWAKKTFRC
ncbi:MAG: hypothetical protein ABSC55_14365 [Syntrophorhabdales bacterium]